MANPRAQVTISAEDKTKRAFGSAKSNVNSLSKSFRGLQGALAGVIGIGGLGAMLKSTIDAADQVQKLSIRLGESTEALSQYRHVAKLTGVEFTQLTTGWQRMTRRIAEAAQGTGEAKNALKELGLSAQELNRLSPEQQFEAIAESMAKVENQSDKVRLAMKLFDSEGVSLLQTMEGGAAAINQMQAEADRLGLTMSQKTANQAAELNDQMTRLNAIFTGFAIQVLPVVADALETVSGWFSDLTSQGEKLGKAIFEITSGRSAQGGKGPSRAPLPTNIPSSVFIPSSTGGGGSRGSAADPLVAFQKSLSSFADSFAEETIAAGEEAMEGLRQVVDQVDPMAPLRRELEMLEGMLETFPQHSDIIMERMLQVNEQMDKSIEETEAAAEEFGASFENAVSFPVGSALGDIIDQTKSVSDAFRAMAADIVSSIGSMLTSSAVSQFQALLFGSPTTGTTGGGGLFGSLLTSFGFAANGAVGSTGLPHGVYNSPTAFPLRGSGMKFFANGAGILGEAGPEAIMPLSRGPDGKLGVQAEGGVNVVVNNNAPVGVSTRQNGNDLEITINEITQQISRGGTPLSRAFENSYGLGRAARGFG